MSVLVLVLLLESRAGGRGSYLPVGLSRGASRRAVDTSTCLELFVVFVVSLAVVVDTKLQITIV